MKKSQYKLQQKCLKFIQDNLRAPPWRLVKQWGQKLNLPLQEIKQISDGLSLRNQLGKTQECLFKSFVN